MVCTAADRVKYSRNQLLPMNFEPRLSCHVSVNMEGVGSIQYNGMNSQDEAEKVPLVHHEQEINDIARRNKHKREKHGTT